MLLYIKYSLKKADYKLKLFASSIWCLFILVLCLLPGSDLSKLSWLDFLGLDKLIHIAFYSIAAVLWSFSFTNNIKKPMFSSQLFILLFLTIYGFVIEYLQLTFTDRHFDILDGLANFLGTMLGIFYYYYVGYKSIFSTPLP